MTSSLARSLAALLLQFFPQAMEELGSSLVLSFGAGDLEAQME